MKTLNVLIGCEFSGIVRDAFIARGHAAVSCDLLPTERPGPHLQGDIFHVLGKGYLHWDLLIAHWPCTRLTVAAAKWLYHPDDTALPESQRRVHPDYPDRLNQLHMDVLAHKSLFAANVNRVALENPIGRLSTLWQKPTQIIQPWQFGHQEMKATCLWLRNLPRLTPTAIVGPPPKDREARKSWERVHRARPGPDRWKERSRTLQGIADAMAMQWGSLDK